MSLMRLTPVGRPHRVEARTRPETGQVRLEFARSDCKPSPSIMLSMEECANLLRALQSARDEAFRRAATDAKRARVSADLDRVVDKVARSLEPRSA